MLFFLEMDMLFMEQKVLGDLGAVHRTDVSAYILLMQKSFIILLEILA